MTIAAIIQQMRENGIPEAITRLPLSQFGEPGRRYLGAEFLPERLVMDHAWREEGIRFRTIIAPDGTRYSSVQRRGNDLYASFLVELGNSDIGADMTTQQYETLMRYANNNSMSRQAIMQVTNWSNVRIVNALIENAEYQRWQAIVNNRVVRVGDNGYREVVQYSRPATHNIYAAQSWTDVSPGPSTDIFDQIAQAAQVMIDKGYTPGRIVTSTRVTNIMARNATVKQRGGVAVVSGAGTIQMSRPRVTFDLMNQMLSDDGLPPMERYDLQFRTQTGTRRFLPNDCMVIFASTERSQEWPMFSGSVPAGSNTAVSNMGGGELSVDYRDIFPEGNFGSVLGYHAIGRAAGQTTPGRHMIVQSFENKPPRVEAEGWMTHLPVIQEPEAVVVITGIR